MSSDKKSRNFVLCLGVQKAGTTWLHDYLDGHPQTDMGFTKEYHILETVSPRSGTRRLTEKKERAIKLLQRQEDPFTGANPGFWRRFSFYMDRESYYDYFTGLLQADGIFVTGDMTPDNSLATPEILQHLADGFARRKVNVKPVVLLRDPVERCWSAVRMGKKTALAGKSRRPEKGDGDDATLLRKSYKSKGRSHRTRYDELFNEIEKVFSRDAFYVGFYETLFTEEEIARLCNFLQVEYTPASFSKRVNVTEKTSDIPDDLRREVAEEYSAAYKYCADRWGRDFILGIWPNAHYVL
ncbi:MAG: sulfotransferase [Roseinatronobacter sp.]